MSGSMIQTLAPDVTVSKKTNQEKKERETRENFQGFASSIVFEISLTPNQLLQPKMDLHFVKSPPLTVDRCCLLIYNSYLYVISNPTLQNLVKSPLNSSSRINLIFLKKLKNTKYAAHVV